MMNRRIILTALSLLNAQSIMAAEVTRAPYLQLATSDSMQIVWRTDGATAPVVRFGTTMDNLDNSVPLADILVRMVAGKDASGYPLWQGKEAVSAPSNTVQYEARVTGLKPAERYFYAIYDKDKRITPADASYQFTTHPTIGSKKPVKFWVVGDSGTGGAMQKAVHEGMQKYMESSKLDFYLHVGDMAYRSGTDPEFSRNFFNMYEPTLRNTVCWASMGNHEGQTSSGETQKGPYYDAYVLPTKAEAGGLASGTEAYYSFDYANTHFICLDSHDLDRRPLGAMAMWLKADLQKTKADWLVAFWHHPPYTKGSHDSDREQQLIEMREHIMPILEGSGVDAVFTGHSHIYERSMLIDGAYATPSTNQGVVLDDGDGDPKGDGAYKKSAGLAPHNGTVQVVTGHGGTGLRRKSNHPLMSKVIMLHGSMIMEIKGDKLTGEMIDVHGAVLDTFVIEKGGKVTRSIVENPRAPKLIEPEPKAKSSKPHSMPKNYSNVIPRGATWHYLAGAKLHPAKGWASAPFDVSDWKLGAAGFGYSDKDDKTELDMKNKYSAVYIRKEFTLEAGADFSALGLGVSYDDAIIVYLNGKEVVRRGVDSGAGSKAKGFHTHEAGKLEYFPLGANKKLLKPGVNVIAIEGHNAGIGSSDFSLDPVLILKN